MHIQDLSLSGLKLLTCAVHQDERGFFKESYRKSQFLSLGISCDFVQDNQSYSSRGTLRGMHFQRSPGQAKLVSVIKGKIFDVVVDIRPESATKGKWLGIYLEAEKHQMLFIPVGFAHGFCVLSEDAHLLYKVSSPYDPNEEKGFHFDDPDIGIIWPITKPILSERDLKAPSFKEVCA